MGDVILTTPLIRQLRTAFPGARIAYLTEARFAPLLENNPHLDEILRLPMHTGSGGAPDGLARQLSFIRHVRAQRFDLVIDLFGNPRSALLTWLSGAKWRVGGDFRGRGRLYNLRVGAPPQPLDAIAFHGLSLQRLGMPLESTETELFLTLPERDGARAFLRARGLDPDRPIIGMHPGATWPNKRWPAENFVALARRFLDAMGQVFISCGPGEEALVSKFAALAADGAVIGPVLPLRRLAAVLASLNLCIANDCGVMHMAVAVGTPTIGIFGPGEPEIWFPYRENAGHKAFFADLACRPCHRDVCPLGTLECMHRTTVDSVFREAMSRLKVQRAGEA